MKRIGKIKISKQFVVEEPKMMLEYIKTLKFIPYEYNLITDHVFEVTGYSEYFEEDYSIPEYEVILGSRPNILTTKQETFIIKVEKTK